MKPLPPTKNVERPAAIEVHIDTLVVDGVSVRNAEYLGAAVKNELQNLLAGQGLNHLPDGTSSEKFHRIKSLQAPTIRLARTPHAADVGEKIARAIHGGLRA